MTHAELKAGEVAGTYLVTSPVTETDIITMAKRFARRKLAKGRKITQPSQAFEHLQLLLQDYEHEVFSVLFLDSQHRVIRFEELLRGTIDAASVYPREVLKAALATTLLLSSWCITIQTVIPSQVIQIDVSPSGS